MNDLELNGGEINGDRIVYVDGGSSSFLFAASGYGKNAILGRGSAQVAYNSSLSQQVRKFLSGGVSAQFAPKTLPAQIRKFIRSDLQVRFLVDGELKRLANAEGATISEFVFEGEARLSGPVRTTFIIEFNANTDAAIKRSVFGYPKQAYIETRTYVPDLKNATKHLVGRAQIRVPSRFALNQQQSLSASSSRHMVVGGEVRLGGRSALTGKSVLSLFASADLSTMHRVYLSGQADIALSMTWGLESKPAHSFAFISAKPDRIMMVPMDNRKLIVPLGAE